jgi:hypothetical protein
VLARTRSCHVHSVDGLVFVYIGYILLVSFYGTVYISIINLYDQKIIFKKAEDSIS